MPRNSSGVYNLPATVNPVIGGTVIASTWANTTMDDIAVAITDSLDRHGRGSMVAPFRFTDGTSGAPGIAWAAEQNSGLYRSGAAETRMGIVGTDRMRWTGTAVQIWDLTALPSPVWVDVKLDDGKGGIPDGSSNNDAIIWDGAAWVPQPMDSAIVTYDPTGSGMSATFVQPAIDELDTNIDAVNTSLGSHTGNTGIHFPDAPDSQNYLRNNGAWVVGDTVYYEIGDTVGNAAQAANADTVDNKHVVVTSTHPGGAADPDTLYFITP